MLLSTSSSSRAVAGALCCALASTAMGAGNATHDQKLSYHFPKGDAATILAQFATQTGRPILFMMNHVRGAKTNALAGSYTSREALDRLLAGTGLVAVQDPKSGGFIVSPQPVVSSPPSKPEVDSASQSTTAPQTKPIKPNASLPMNKHPFLSLVVGWIVAGAALDAQTAVTRPKDQGDVVQLNPFEVNTSKDTSYGAINSTSISTFNMQLLKTPVAVDVFTDEFMRDSATTSVEDLLSSYGAGYGQSDPLNSTSAGEYGDRNGVPQSGTRGVMAGSTRRDGFLATGTNANFTDTFDIERVEVVKGANGLLFGSSSAGGFVNTTSKLAHFGNDSRPLMTGTLTSRIDQFGSKRWQLDANYGVKNLAFRFVMMNEDLSTRRLFLGGETEALYGTIAAKLPFNTVARLNIRHTDNDRITNTTVNDLSFTNTTRDPRNLFSLEYLLATNQAGAANPRTGAAYPAGAVANGKLDWNNASSWGGWANEEDVNGENYTLTIDSVWTKWLSTSLGAMYDRAVSWRGVGVTALLAPHTFNSTNPYDEWANGSTFSVNRDNDINSGRRFSYRGNAMLTNDLFGGRAKSQTVIGYDLNFAPWSNGGKISYAYYEADGNFHLFDSSHPRPAELGGTSGADAIGRISMPTLYWPVGGGPVKKPYFHTGSRNVTVNGRNYVLVQQDPRNPNWETPLNPLGLLSLVPGYSSIPGFNLGHDAQPGRNWGIYGANYTRWFDDRFTTLFGYRYTNTFTRDPNASTSGTVGWTDTESKQASYNLGLTYKIKSWLYAYYNAGRTFSPSIRPGDFVGNPPHPTIGFSHEIGFKYEPANARVSGSLSYYTDNSRGEAYNYGSYLGLINPVGINDAYNPQNRNGWLPLDKEASGLELILTAAPTRNWRARLGFTQQDGKIRSTSAYNLLWNDEFYYNKLSGGVTYSDGTPFLVPIDAAGVAAVNGTSTLRAPVVGATNTQLTVAMMNDSTSPYYAYGQGGTTSPNGQIANNSTLFRALRYFQIPSGSQFLQARTLRTGLPVSAIPYRFDDPSGLNGLAVLASAGEPTTGQPLYRIVFTNAYDFREGWLRGVTVGATVRWDIDKPTYWYSQSNGKGGSVRLLYQESTINPQVTSFLAYSRKIGHYLYRTQLNVNNMFNRYQVEIRPGATTGYTVENALGASFVGEPRQYVWTNTVSY